MSISSDFSIVSPEVSQDVDLDFTITTDLLTIEVDEPTITLGESFDKVSLFTFYDCLAEDALAFCKIGEDVCIQDLPHDVKDELCAHLNLPTYGTSLRNWETIAAKLGGTVDLIMYPNPTGELLRKLQQFKANVLFEAIAEAGRVDTLVSLRKYVRRGIKKRGALEVAPRSVTASYSQASTSRMWDSDVDVILVTHLETERDERRAYKKLMKNLRKDLEHSCLRILDLAEIDVSENFFAVLSSAFEKATHVLFCLSDVYCDALRNESASMSEYNKAIKIIHDLSNAEFSNNGSRNRRFRPILMQESAAQRLPLGWPSATTIYRWESDYYRLLSRLKASPGASQQFSQFIAKMNQPMRCCCRYCGAEFVSKRQLFAHRKVCNPSMVVRCSRCSVGLRSHKQLAEHEAAVHAADSKTQVECFASEAEFKNWLAIKCHETNTSMLIRRSSTTRIFYRCSYAVHCSRKNKKRLRVPEPISHCSAFLDVTVRESGEHKVVYNFAHSHEPDPRMIRYKGSVVEQKVVALLKLGYTPRKILQKLNGETANVENPSIYEQALLLQDVIYIQLRYCRETGHEIEAAEAPTTSDTRIEISEVAEVRSKVRCRHCKINFASTELLESHRFEFHSTMRTLSCFLCSTTFKTFEERIVHIARVHDERAKIEKLFFETPEGFANWLKRHQDETGSSFVIRSSTKQNVIYKCMYSSSVSRGRPHDDQCYAFVHRYEKSDGTVFVKYCNFHNHNSKTNDHSRLNKISEAHSLATQIASIRVQSKVDECVIICNNESFTVKFMDRCCCSRDWNYHCPDCGCCPYAFHCSCKLRNPLGVCCIHIHLLYMTRKVSPRNAVNSTKHTQKLPNFYNNFSSISAEAALPQENAHAKDSSFTPPNNSLMYGQQFEEDRRETVFYAKALYHAVTALPPNSLHAELLPVLKSCMSKLSTSLQSVSRSWVKARQMPTTLASP